MLHPRREKERKYPSISDHYIEKIRDVSSCVCKYRKAHITLTVFIEHHVNLGNFKGLILRV